MMKIIFAGQVSVNLLVIIIILGCRFFLIEYFNMRSLDAGIIGIALGWIYWHFAIKVWIRWFYRNGYTKETILKKGRKNLLLWHMSTVEKAIK